MALSIVATSCQGGGVPKTTADSLAYAQGLADGRQYSEIIEMNTKQGLVMDKAAFFKGFKEGLVDTTSFSYFAGGFTAARMSKQFVADSVVLRQYLAAFELAIKSNSEDSTKFLLSDSLIQELVSVARTQSYERERRKQEEEFEKKYGQNRQKGEDFINEFKKEEGVITTESGLAYKYLAQGNGATPTADDKVKVSYAGTLINGTEFDKNDDIEFSVTGVIPGWTEMLQLMKVGDKVKVVIPYELAYGSQGAGGRIEPYSTLVFEMELKAITTDKKK